MKETLAKYWEALDEKQRRLLWDVMRLNVSRRNMPMGLLPFVPVKEVLKTLRQNPMSPWTAHLHYEYLTKMDEDRSYWRADAHAMKYAVSWDHDKADYAKIIAILEYRPATPSHLAAQIERWKQQHGGE